MLKQIRDSLSLQIIVALAFGLILGPILGERAIVLGELGKVFITLIKAIAAPLVFFAIVDAILKTDLQLKSAGRLFGITAINATFAAIIGLSLSNIFKPGEHLKLDELKAPAQPTKLMTEGIDFIKTLKGYIPESLVQPFSENSILMIVLVAILFGAAIRSLRKDPESLEHSKGFQNLEDIFGALFKVHEKLLHWIVKLTPLAVFGVVTRTIGEYGFTPFKGLAWYVGVGLLGLALQPLLVYHSWIRWVKGWSLRHFWKEAKEPVVFGIGCNSSLATLPLTLRALDRLQVSKSASRLGACVGTNLNNDGILLYEAMAVLFVAQYHGLHLGLIDQVQAAFICVIAAIGIAGVPEAGIVSLSLVLSTVGLPLEILPLLITVDWILARGRTVVNVLADMTVSSVLDKAGKGRDRPLPE